MGAALYGGPDRRAVHAGYRYTPTTVTYTYTGPQLQRVQEGPTTYASYSGFNALGQPSTLTLGNGTTTTYTYNAQTYRLKTLRTVQGSTVLQDLGYTFDSGGNVTAITDPRHGNQTYTYDDLDRLTGATNSATGGYGTLTYTYNQIGNMLTNSKVGTYSYNTSGATSVRPHAVANTSLTTGTGDDAETTTTTYSYDANGNLSLGDGRTLTWDAENRPTQIVKGDVTTTFVYDGDGGRVKKTVSRTQGGTTTTSTTVYIGQLYVCEGTTCARLIYAGTQRVALVQEGSGSTSYFHGDHLGSTSVLTDSSGTAEEHNSYRPYGDMQTHTGTSDVAYKYTGQERDTSTALYFYQARYYAQGLGRFVSPDPIVPNFLDPQAFNRYAYVRNNPMRYTDPTGYWWTDWIDWGSWGIDWGADWGVGNFSGGGSSWGSWGSGAGSYTPTPGVDVLDEIVVTATRLPPAAWFPDPFGRDAWGFNPGIPPVSNPFVTLVGGTESQRQFLGEVSGAGTTMTFIAGPTIFIKPYSPSIGPDPFIYTVDYYQVDPRDPMGKRVIPEFRAPESVRKFPIQRAITGIGFNGISDKTFTAAGIYGRVKWVVSIPRLNTYVHQNSAGWNLRVYEIP